MSVGFIPVFNPHVSKAQFVSDGKALIAEAEVLNDITKQLGLEAFTSFADERPIPEDFDGDQDELDELLGPWEDWFSIDDGLLVFDQLVRFVAANPHLRWRRYDHEDVLGELEELARSLRTAAAAGATFRLEAM